MAEILITNTRADLIPQLVELQIICYPTLADSSRLKAPHFDSHLQIFPEGQWVALDGERVVGMSAGFLYTFDLWCRRQRASRLSPPWHQPSPL